MGAARAKLGCCVVYESDAQSVAAVLASCGQSNLNVRVLSNTGSKCSSICRKAGELSLSLSSRPASVISQDLS